MPRARNLKPGFFKDAKVVSCSFEARLLFQGLWCLADYKGRLKYVPLEIKMEIFPGDNVDIEACMDELRVQGLVEIYLDRSGTTLVQVRNFDLHQNPHVNERQDKKKNPLPCLPSVEECAKGESRKDDIKQQVEGALRVLREYSESDPADSLVLIPDSLVLIPELKQDPPAGDLSETKQLRSEYAYEGDKFNINQNDFAKHQKLFPNLDLLQEYPQLDLELRDTTKKQIWGTLNAKLNYRNTKRQPSNQHSQQAKLSTIEQSTEINREHHERVTREIAELEARAGYDGAMGLVNS